MNKKTMIYIVRHGETDWNITRRMQGATDIPLNEKGRKQAEAIAKHLATINLDAIYSSPLKRALETGKIIAAYHKQTPFVVNTALIEKSFGVLEGRTREEYNNYHPSLKWENSWSYPDFRPPEGESLRDVHMRTKKFIRKILQSHRGEKIVLVAHGITIRLLIAAIVCTPIELLGMYETQNASLTILEHSDIHGPSFHVSNYLPEERV